MAIKIIKAGKNIIEKQFKIDCSYCGCEFSFQAADVCYERDDSYVECPTPSCPKFIGISNAEEIN